MKGFTLKIFLAALLMVIVGVGSAIDSDPETLTFGQLVYIFIFSYAIFEQLHLGALQGFGKRIRSIFIWWLILVAGSGITLGYVNLGTLVGGIPLAIVLSAAWGVIVQVLVFMPRSQAQEENDLVWMVIDSTRNPDQLDPPELMRNRMRGLSPEQARYLQENKQQIREMAYRTRGNGKRPVDMLTAAEREVFNRVTK